MVFRHRKSKLLICWGDVLLIEVNHEIRAILKHRISVQSSEILQEIQQAFQCLSFRVELTDEVIEISCLSSRLT